MTGEALTGLPVASGRRAARVLAALLRPRWPALLVVALAGLLGAAAGLVAPWVIGRLVDALREGATLQQVLAGALAVVLAGVVAAAAAWAGRAWLGRVTEPTVAQLRARVMDSALALESHTVESTGVGDLVARVADDAREVTKAASTVLPLVVQSLFTIVVSAVGLLALDWRLGLVSLVALPMYWLTLRWYLPRSGPLYAEERRAFGTRASRLLGGLSGARTLRAYEASEVELARIEAASAEARDLSVGVFRFLTRAFSRNNRAEAVVLSLVLAAGFLLVWWDEASPGMVATAALVFHRLFNPIGAVVGLFDQVQSAGASLTRMVGVMGASAPERSSHAPAGPLVLRGVSHAYREGETVVGPVDLTIEPGTVVAVVGTTGAGKSTLAQIVAGVLTPTSGTVTLGGEDLGGLEPAALRGRIAMVAQEVHSFGTSIEENVVLARPEAGPEGAARALARLGAAWVNDLPSGARTPIGEGETLLTPMQHQVLALARVEVADPDFVVLDEATAEAGSSGARELDAAAARVLEGRGGLVVIHRLAQAAGADRILVMDRGAIVEDGTHEQLMAADGRYAELWHAWKG